MKIVILSLSLLLFPAYAPQDDGRAREDFNALELKGRRADTSERQARRAGVERARREQIEKGRRDAKDAAKQLADMSRELNQEMDTLGQGVISATLPERLNKMEKLLKVIRNNAKAF